MAHSRFISAIMCTLLSVNTLTLVFAGLMAWLGYAIPVRLKQLGFAPELVIWIGFGSLLVACLGLCGLNYSSSQLVYLYALSCMVFALLLVIGLPEIVYKPKQNMNIIGPRRGSSPKIATTPNAPTTTLSSPNTSLDNEPNSNINSVPSYVFRDIMYFSLISLLFLLIIISIIFAHHLSKKRQTQQDQLQDHQQRQPSKRFSRWSFKNHYHFQHDGGHRLSESGGELTTSVQHQPLGASPISIGGNTIPSLLLPSSNINQHHRHYNSNGSPNMINSTNKLIPQRSKSLAAPLISHELICLCRNRHDNNQHYCASSSIISNNSDSQQPIYQDSNKIEQRYLGTNSLKLHNNNNNKASPNHSMGHDNDNDESLLESSGRSMADLDVEFHKKRNHLSQYRRHRCDNENNNNNNHQGRRSREGRLIANDDPLITDGDDDDESIQMGTGHSNENLAVNNNDNAINDAINKRNPNNNQNVARPSMALTNSSLEQSCISCLSSVNQHQLNHSCHQNHSNKSLSNSCCRLNHCCSSLAAPCCLRSGVYHSDHRVAVHQNQGNNNQSNSNADFRLQAKANLSTNDQRHRQQLSKSCSSQFVANLANNRHPQNITSASGNHLKSAEIKCTCPSPIQPVYVSDKLDPYGSREFSHYYHYVSPTGAPTLEAGGLRLQQQNSTILSNKRVPIQNYPTNHLNPYKSTFAINRIKARQNNVLLNNRSSVGKSKKKQSGASSVMAMTAAAAAALFGGVVDTASAVDNGDQFDDIHQIQNSEFNEMPSNEMSAGAVDCSCELSGATNGHNHLEIPLLELDSQHTIGWTTRANEPLLDFGPLMSHETASSQVHNYHNDNYLPFQHNANSNNSVIKKQ